MTDDIFEACILKEGERCLTLIGCKYIPFPFKVRYSYLSFLIYIAIIHRHKFNCVPLSREENGIYVISIANEIVACTETQNYHIIVLQCSW